MRAYNKIPVIADEAMTGILFLRTTTTQGTGSYPLPPQGWQRRMRLMERQSPLTGPCFLSACTAYSEQLGTYLQDAGVKGEIQYL
jgi:hypothetical protein